MFKGDYLSLIMLMVMLSCHVMSRYVTLPTSALPGFHEGPLSWSNVLEFGVLLLLFFFWGGGGWGERKSGNQQQNQPTHGPGQARALTTAPSLLHEFPFPVYQTRTYLQNSLLRYVKLSLVVFNAMLESFWRNSKSKNYGTRSTSFPGSLMAWKVICLYWR